MIYGKRAPQSGKPKIAKKRPARPAKPDGRVAGLGSILGIWAHPDDESFMMAGLMALAVANGQKVACITATKGEVGQVDKAKHPGVLGEIRAKELEKALEILGVKEHHWLGFIDGQCHKVPDLEAIKKVAFYIEKYQPDTIITFPPDGITGHDDHKAASRWAHGAIKHIGSKAKLYYAVDTQENYDHYFKEIDEKFNIYFNIDKPVLLKRAKCDLVLDLPEDAKHKKMLALKAQATQTEGMFAQFGEELFASALGIEAYVLADSKNPAKWPN